MILKDQMHKIEQADQEEKEREQEEKEDKIKFQKKQKINKQKGEQARNIIEPNLKNDVIKI